ncbi:MAG TPA: IS256 family transposase [Desulfatiglandales bacterium]|nr:IS256 family transposase [Desulfatiglandales bacterium]
MKVEISVPEIVAIFKEIQEQPERIFEMIRVEIRENVGEYLSKLMDMERTQFLEREWYEHGQGEVNHRNGSYPRNFTLKGIGEVKVEVPRDRKGEFTTQVIPRSKRYENELRQDLSVMFLTGVSTRTLSMISTRLIGSKISPTEISNANKELIDAVEKWRTRDLSGETIKYIFLDGVNFDMRIDGSIEKVPVLVAIGVTETGQKLVLGFQAGDKESAPTWREFFKDLKGRGLDGSTMVLGVMDGLPGLEKVFKEEFPKAKVQRCQVHVARNVLAKVPKKLKKAVADDMRSIFYASSKSKAMEFFDIFKDRWQRDLPSAVKCLENSLEACLTFFICPEEEWISLRTTNIIERLNKEFKRRTKPMEIVAGENACYTLLAFICLKMELHWKSNPIGKVRKNLPFLKELEDKKFTQKI